MELFSKINHFLIKFITIPKYKKFKNLHFCEIYTYELLCKRMGKSRSKKLKKIILWKKRFPVKPVSVCALWERAIVAPQKKPISRFCVVPSLSQKMGQNLVYNYSCKRFEVLQSQKMKPYPPSRFVFLTIQKSPMNGLHF